MKSKYANMFSCDKLRIQYFNVDEETRDMQFRRKENCENKFRSIFLTLHSKLLSGANNKNAYFYVQNKRGLCNRSCPIILFLGTKQLRLPQ